MRGSSVCLRARERKAPATGFLRAGANWTILSASDATSATLATQFQAAPGIARKFASAQIFNITSR